MKKMMMLLLCMLLSNASLAAESTEYYTEDKPNIMVSKDHPQFTLKLKSNPTTGYSWYLREYNSRVITPIKQSFEPSKQQLIGAPGYEFWTFKVKPDGFVVPQQMMIRMIYARPFSTDGGTQVIFRVSTQGK